MGTCAGGRLSDGVAVEEAGGSGLPSGRDAKSVVGSGAVSKEETKITTHAAVPIPTMANAPAAIPKSMRAALPPPRACRATGECPDRRRGGGLWGRFRGVWECCGDLPGPLLMSISLVLGLKTLYQINRLPVDLCVNPIADVTILLQVVKQLQHLATPLGVVGNKYLLVRIVLMGLFRKL